MWELNCHFENWSFVFKKKNCIVSSEGDDLKKLRSKI